VVFDFGSLEIPPKTPLPKGGCCRTLSDDNGTFDRAQI